MIKAKINESGNNSKMIELKNIFFFSLKKIFLSLWCPEWKFKEGQNETVVTCETVSIYPLPPWVTVHTFPVLLTPAGCVLGLVVWVQNLSSERCTGSHSTTAG